MIAGAKAECQRSGKHNASQDDQESLLDHATADIQMIDRQQNNKGQDSVARNASQQVTVADVGAATIALNGHADKARKVAAENDDQQCHQYFRYEQQQLAEQVRHQQQSETVEGNNQGYKYRGRI